MVNLTAGDLGLLLSAINLARTQADREKVRQLLREVIPDQELYRLDPTFYADEVLHTTWWWKQQEIARSLLRSPYRTLVKSSHKVGKTHLAGGLVNWWYDNFNPSVCLTTAPKLEQVKDLLWKEVRAQRRGRKGFTGPRSLRLQDSPKHYAKGMTAKESAGFHGQHEEHVFVILDEGVGVAGEFWDAAKSMATGPGHAILALYNPTDPTSRAYQEEQATDENGNPLWNVITVSALDHPNILAELQGNPPPFPGAIRLNYVRDLMRQWCTPVEDGKPLATDVEWPPGSGKWVRPGAIAEARLLGRWPSQGSYSVWSDAAWEIAAKTILPIPPGAMAEIGCDVARQGDDWTEFHVRAGPVSLGHHAYNKRDTVWTVGMLKAIAKECAAMTTAWRQSAAKPIEPTEIRIKVDDDGVGGGVTDMLRADGYRVVPIRAGTRARAADDYPNKRSELWFDLAEGRALKGQLSLVRLPKDICQRLKQQAMAPVWKVDIKGRRVVEPKDKTKEKIGRSPDGMDAMNLAYYESAPFEAATVEKAAHEEASRDMTPAETPVRDTNQAKRGLLGITTVRRKGNAARRGMYGLG